MEQADRKEWKAQLNYADQVWYQAGILDDSTGAWRAPGTVPIYRYIQDYRGDQAQPFGGADLAESDRFIANLSFSIVNTVLSSISGRDPEPIVRARGGSLAAVDAQKRARLNRLVLKLVLREGHYKREVDRALQCALSAPFGLVRHGFTPGIEEYSDGERVFTRFKNERPDFPWIRYTPPWDVRIDPLASQFDPDQSPRWVAFRELYTAQEAQKNPNLVMRDDWKPTYVPPPFDRAKRPSERYIDSPDGPKLYEAWTIFDAIERKWFALGTGCEELVRKEADWPIEWGQLPYSILTLNEQLDSPIGIPFPKLYAHEQAMYNRVWTIINTIISRTRRIVFVNGQAFEGKEDQKENLFAMRALSEFIEIGGDPGTVLKEIGLGTIDPQLVGLLYQLREGVREVVGVSQFDRGQRANVETATEASLIGSGAATQRSRVQEKHELFWTNIMTVAHRATHQLDDDRSLYIPLEESAADTRLPLSEGQDGYTRATLPELRGDFDIAVRLNSTLPLDTSQQFARGMAVFQGLGGPNSNMLNQYNVQRDLVDFAEMDPDRWVVSQEVVQQMAAKNQAEAQGAQGGPEPQNASALEQQGTDAATSSVLASLPGGLQ